MELVQYEKAYLINDKTEKGWVVNGQVFKEANGEISISWSVSVEGSHVGGFNYDINTENRVNTNISIVRNYEKDFVEYSEKLLSNVLVELGINAE